MSFFGRTFELSLLDEYYDDGNANLAVVYGRRRVGKSELILQGTAKYYLPRSKASWNRLRMSSTKTQLASMSE